MLKIWDWMSGAVQYEFPILDAVRPFIVIPQPKRVVDEEDEDEGTRGKLEGKGKGKDEVVQSSGTGKSRTIDELSKARLTGRRHRGIVSGSPSLYAFSAGGLFW
ncbi:hypothetical protein JOM56_007529 [Amanita muscaria]